MFMLPATVASSMRRLDEPYDATCAISTATFLMMITFLAGVQRMHTFKVAVAIQTVVVTPFDGDLWPVGSVVSMKTAFVLNLSHFCRPPLQSHLRRRGLSAERIIPGFLVIIPALITRISRCLLCNILL